MKTELYFVLKCKMLAIQTSKKQNDLLTKIAFLLRNFHPHLFYLLLVMLSNFQSFLIFVLNLQPKNFFVQRLIFHK
jgi:hypothetical protein